MNTDECFISKLDTATALFLTKNNENDFLKRLLN